MVENELVAVEDRPPHVLEHPPDLTLARDQDLRRDGQLFRTWFATESGDEQKLNLVLRCSLARTELMEPSPGFERDRRADQIAVEHHEPLRNRSVERRRLIPLVGSKRDDELTHPLLAPPLLLLQIPLAIGLSGNR